MKKDTILADLTKLNKLQLKYFGYTVDEMIAMDAEKELAPDEIEGLALRAASFYRQDFERVVNKLMALEAKNIAEQTETESQLMFYRGALYGMLNIKKWFLSQIVLASKRQDRSAENINPTEL